VAGQGRRERVASAVAGGSAAGRAVPLTGGRIPRCARAPRPRRAPRLAAALAVAALLLACAPSPPAARSGGPAPAPAAAPAAGAVPPATTSAAAPAASAAPPAAPTPARPPRPVTVAVPSTTMPFLPFYVAKEKGFDAANGLAMETPLIVGRVGVQTMVGGNLDFSASAGSVLNARLGGAPVVVLMLSIDKSTYMLYAQPDVRTPADLKGKTVAVDAVGSSLYTELGLAFQTLGLSLTDVSIVGVPGNARVATLANGAAAAVVIAAPQDVELERLGQGYHKLLDLGDYAVGINGGLGAATALVQAQPDLVDDVVTTTLMGLRYIRENRAGTIPLIQSFLDTDAETAALIYDRTVHAYSDGASTPETRAEIARHAAEVLQLGEDVPLDELYDLGPYERAAARLAARGWRPD